MFAGLLEESTLGLLREGVLPGLTRGTSQRPPPLRGATMLIADARSWSSVLASELGRTDLGPGAMGGITNFSGTFAGGAFGRRDGKALAACGGVEWIASGMLPGRYSKEDPAQEYWGDAISFKDGFVYLVSGNCDDFTLLILTDDASFAARREAETYCGYGIVTRVTGGAGEREWECCYEDQLICIKIHVQLTVERALALTGKLVPLFWGWLGLEVIFGNEAHLDGSGFDTTTIGKVRFGTRDSFVAGSSAETSGLYPFPTHKIAVNTWECSVCSNAGNAAGVALDDLVSWVRASAPGDPALDGGVYFGGPACDVPHALHLLEGVGVWDQCEAWVEELCEATPMEECAEPTGVDDPDEPGAGSTSSP